ncbi:MAG: right-handed parallel beta-helix repeat-containing protein [Candidatus Zixiibacteriota bacterium]|nr:MAG: right-handed parallel beta-helix repeat-containing protein [candidate division Zixibacteria bacterium]
MRTCIVFFAVMLLSGSVHSTTIHVPADQPTIQAGIDAAIVGDTVLVANGTYTGDGNRDIDFHGKGVVLKSEHGPNLTIIDCQGSGRGFYFHSGEDSTTVVSGFTIQGGSGHHDGPDGRPAGGGIMCDSSSSPRIINNTISGNSAVCRCGGTGGGIHCTNSNPTISNSTICGNSAVSGGGIFCHESSPIIINTIFWANNPTEVSVDDASLPAITYCDISGGWEGEGNIDSNPLFLDPYNGNYNVCSQSPCIDAGDLDMTDPDGSRSDIGVFYPEHPECFVGNVWYVSTAGNDTTGDGSPGDPFRTIQHAINVSFYGDTVIVLNGTYVENIHINWKSIVLASNYICSGDILDIQNTVIDGGSVSSVVNFELCDSLTAITGFTIRNGSAGGIRCSSTSPTISSNVISGNSASYGGGIACWSSNPTISSNTLSGNSASSGGGIYCSNSSPTIINTIIWGNSGSQIRIGGSGSPIITYCDIAGGWEGEGNIDVDPLFVDACNGNYNVCSQSPCVDAGNPDTLDPDGTRSDIGVFYPDHPECSFGNIRYVATGGNDTSGDGSPGNPFRTIQHAINVSFHSDSVIVENGTYMEHINFNGKSILVASNYVFSGDASDVQNTIIDGNWDSTVVTFNSNEDSSAMIMGFTIRSGSAYSGGGIRCYASNPTITGNTISGNSGGGLSCWYSSPTIDDNTFSENSVGREWFGYGGGINCYTSSPTISNNTITGNSVVWYGSGGGISCRNNSDPTISNNVISGNSAGEFEGSGGGIHCDNSNPIISYNTITENSAVDIGGGICCRESSPTISDNTIAGNSRSGIHCSHNSSPTIAKNTISGNSSYYGGGIRCHASNPSIINNTITGNSAYVQGSGIYCSESNPTISNTVIAFSSRGRAIDCDAGGNPVLTNCDIYGNAGGDWVGCVVEQAGTNGNFSADPLFCDAAQGIFSLQAGSPCAPANNSGGVLIGALDVGCGTYICGDTDGDGEVTWNDLTLLTEYYFNGGDGNWPTSIIFGNLNLNGVIDIADIVWLSYYLNGYATPPCYGGTGQRDVKKAARDTAIE